MEEETKQLNFKDVFLKYWYWGVIGLAIVGMVYYAVMYADAINQYNELYFYCDATIKNLTDSCVLG